MKIADGTERINILTNVYEHCPVYQTESFIFRLVKIEDAEALLKCYSDKDTVLKLNSDYCTSDFFYTTKQEMEQCIKFWLEEYKKQYYVRFAVIPKSENQAVGTIEIFGGEAGVLRIDLAKEYESKNNIIEIVKLAISTFSEDFGIGSIKIKILNTPERIKWLEHLGFVISEKFRPELGYHEFDIMKNR